MIAEHSDAFEALLTAVQAAELLNLHPNTLLLWARSGRVPSMRLGRRVVFRASALNNWLSEQYTDVAVRAAQPERMAA
jgi:excisionase family DNA binding protein